MADRMNIMNMLKQLQVVDESVISNYRNQDGYNYANDHSPIGLEEAVKKVQLFIEFGGKLTQHPDHVQVKWQAHSEGMLVIYRFGESRYFAHGWIDAG